jgi:hypothetical protein
MLDVGGRLSVQREHSYTGVDEVATLSSLRERSNTRRISDVAR